MSVMNLKLILIPPLHMKLGLMKNSEKVLNNTVMVNMLKGKVSKTE
jgi:hypothetical protein